MNRIAFSILATMGAAIGVAHAQVPLIVGSWDLNSETSIYPGPLPRSQVRTYLPLDDGFLLGIAVSLATLQISGDPTSSTYSETQLDDHTVSWVDKSNGVPHASGTRQVSEDGQTLTIEFEIQDPEGQVQNFRLVYDKQ